MPYYQGTSRSRFYRGNGRPLNRYSGTSKVVGWEPETRTGESLTIADTYDDTFHNLTVFGGSQQAQQEASANLINLDNRIMRMNSAVVNAGAKTYRDGNTFVYEYYASGGVNGSGGLKVKLESGATYTIKVTSATKTDGTAPIIDIYSYTAEPTTILDSQFGETRIGNRYFVNANPSVTFTMPADRVWCSLIMGTGAVNGDCIIRIVEPRLVKSSIAQGVYEPYRLEIPSKDNYSAINHVGGTLAVSGDGQSQTVEVPQLAGIGSVADFYNITDGVIGRQIGSKVFTGAETFVRYETPGGEYYATQLTNYAGGGLLCTHLSTNTARKSYIFAVGGGYIGFWFPLGTFGTVTAFQAWLSARNTEGNPLTTYYVLQTIVPESVAPIALKTYYQQTNISKTGVSSQISALLKIAQ